MDVCVSECMYLDLCLCGYMCISGVYVNICTKDIFYYYYFL